MKVQLTYDQLKHYAKDTAAYIKGKYPNGCHLVAVVRGGLSFAQLVAYNLAQDLSFFYPKTSALMGGAARPPITPEQALEQLEHPLPIVFLEDIIAKGRTIKIIADAMVHYRNDWEVIPVVVDIFIPMERLTRVNKWYMRTADWVVMPHEDFGAVTEKDWGLFRDGSSGNSKPQV
jgi:hypoxanthine-guanine phosphoribosyltransferase